LTNSESSDQQKPKKDPQRTTDVPGEWQSEKEFRMRSEFTPRLSKGARRRFHAKQALKRAALGITPNLRDYMNGPLIVYKVGEEHPDMRPPPR
jgi:hypothetical protein